MRFPGQKGSLAAVIRWGAVAIVAAAMISVFIVAGRWPSSAQVSCGDGACDLAMGEATATCPPDCDPCENPRSLSGPSGVAAATIEELSTTASGSLYCADGDFPLHVYAWVATQTGTVTFDGCVPETLIPLRLGFVEGESCNVPGLACNEESDCGLGTRLTYAVSGGKTYTLLVSASDGGTGSYGLEWSLCGDESRSGTEECDGRDDAACPGLCGRDCTCASTAECGDGFCDEDEDVYSCPLDCGSCGNGVCDAGERTSTCPADCFCGDGICEFSERRKCKIDCGVCGDGFVQRGEECDDGNALNGDCCDEDCRAEPPGLQTCGGGACQRSVAQCHRGKPLECRPGRPRPEICDEMDNDCDGETDEGLACPSVVLSF